MQSRALVCTTKKEIITLKLSRFISKWYLPNIMNNIRQKYTDLALLCCPQGG